MKKILCVGDSRIDIVVPYDAMKMEAYAGSYSLGRIRCKPGGTVSNCAAMLGKLGGNVSFLGVFSETATGDYLLDDLRRSGVDTSLCIRRKDGMFPVVVAVDADGSQVSDAVLMPGNEYSDFEDWDFDSSLADNYDMLFLSCSGIIGDNSISRTMLRYAESFHMAGKEVAADINLRMKSDDIDSIKNEIVRKVLGCCTLIFGSGEEEFRSVTGERDIRKSAEMLSEGGKIVVARDGVNPVYLVTSSGTSVFPIVKVDPVNTIGAGDSFDAGFLRFYSEGYSPEECVIAGNTCAGYTISSTRFRDVPDIDKIREAVARGTAGKK
ncbi:MAG: carbohydrate kinase family protein [Oscillospiraceae bacterium]|jgi:fructokinase